MRHGVHGRKKSWFQKGHTPVFRPEVQAAKDFPTYIRPSRQQLQLAYARDEKLDFCHTPTELPGRTVMLLRPITEDVTPVSKLQHKEADNHKPGSPCVYRLVDVNATVDFGVEAALEHQQAHPDCTGRPKLQVESEVHRGLAVSEKLCCKQCAFKTSRTKLYSEVAHPGRGRRAAVPNMALQVGLHNTTMAAAATQRLLAALGTTVPSASGLQKAANKCGTIIQNVNISDMAEKRQLVKDIHFMQGFDRDSPIPIEIDRQYNNPLRNCRKRTPFVPATQTRDVLCENVTTKKYVVMYHQENKLCKKVKLATKSGKEGECPQHTGCTATRAAEYNMGNEEEGGSQCAKKLLECKDRLLVHKITTDADGHLARGLISEMQQQAGITPEHLLDPPHLNRSLCSAVSRAEFSEDMFPGYTIQEKRKLQDRFADDISHRTQAEAAAILHKSGGNIVMMQTMAARAATAIVHCYMGHHDICRRLSLVCKGDYKYPYMPVNARGRLHMSYSDKKTLKQILAKRIGPEAIDKTKYGTNTQKCESVNHAFSVTNAKALQTFARNGCARDHSAVHLVNNGHANSIVRKCEAAGCPVLSRSNTAKALARMDKRQRYHTLRAKSKHYKKRRAQCRTQRYNLYNSVQPLYKKSQLDPKTSSESFKKDTNWYLIKDEHNYGRGPNLNRNC